MELRPLPAPPPTTTPPTTKGADGCVCGAVSHCSVPTSVNWRRVALLCTNERQLAPISTHKEGGQKTNNKNTMSSWAWWICVYMCLVYPSMFKYLLSRAHLQTCGTQNEQRGYATEAFKFMVDPCLHVPRLPQACSNIC